MAKSFIERPSRQGKTINLLKGANRLKLVAHLAQNLATYKGGTPDKVAELSSTALGFPVTKWNVATLADTIGLVLEFDHKTRSVITSKVDIYNKIVKVESDLLIRINYIAEQVKAISEDLAALEAKVGAEILS